MRRRLLTGAVAILAAGWASPATADAISVGDSVRILGTTGTLNGGAFLLDNVENGAGVDFLTFCIQRTEYIDYANEFVVGAISQAADDVPTSDPISAETAWIYASFREGHLAPTYGVDAIQAAIWILEQEWTTHVANSGALIAAATAAVGAGWTNQSVSVLNLFRTNGTKAQDQLTYSRPVDTQVPEPAMLLLLGSALAGAAAFSRRRLRVVPVARNRRQD